MNLNAQIRKEKRDLKKHIANVNRILSRSPQKKAQFNALLKKHKVLSKGLGAVEDEKAWYESDFISDILDFAPSVYASHQVSKDEQKALELELQQIEAKNRSLDKQIALQQTLGQKAGAYGSSFMDELFNSPVKLAALVAGGAYLLYSRKPKSRRR